MKSFVFVCYEWMFPFYVSPAVYPQNREVWPQICLEYKSTLSGTNFWSASYLEIYFTKAVLSHCCKVVAVKEFMSLLNLYHIVQCTKRFRGCSLRRELLLFRTNYEYNNPLTPMVSLGLEEYKKHCSSSFQPKKTTMSYFFHQCASIFLKSNVLCFWVIFSCDHVNVWAPLFQIEPSDNGHWVHWVLIVYNCATCPSWYSDTFLGPIFQYLQHHAQNFHLFKLTFPFASLARGNKIELKFDSFTYQDEFWTYNLTYSGLSVHVLTSFSQVWDPRRRWD